VSNDVTPFTAIYMTTHQRVKDPVGLFNPLTPNDHYSGRTAPLTSKRCILYIYSTNIGTEYFKHGICSSFFFFQNAVCLKILTYLVPVLFTFHIQDVLKLKKNNSGAKRLTNQVTSDHDYVGPASHYASEVTFISGSRLPLTVTVGK